MSTPATAVAQPLFDPAQARADQRARWAGTPLADEHWLEGGTGFPAGGIGGQTRAGGIGGQLRAGGIGGDARAAAHSPAEAPATVVASARGYRLIRGHLAEVVAFAEFLAGQAFTGEERHDLERDIVDAFEDSPKRALRSLRPLVGGVKRVTSLDPVRRAQRRLQALTTTYLLELRRQADGHELSPLMSVVSRHNPVVRHRSTAGVVLVADALAARMEQHRLVLCLAGRELGQAPELADRLLARADRAGRMELAELAGSEIRLLMLRAWLRDLGGTELARTREDVSRAVGSAFDIDIVVQQVGHRAALDLCADDRGQGRGSVRPR